MSEKKFDVLFTGNLAEGAQLDQVKANVAKLFKTEVAKIERLFIGMPVMIKKGVDEDTALKYMMAMKKAGAMCEAKEQSGAEASVPPPPPPQTPSAATSAPTQARVEPAPPHARAESRPAATPLDSRRTEPAADASRKSEAEIAAGDEGDMRFVLKEAPEGLGELEGASVDAPGTKIIEPEETAPPQIDTSGMSLDQSGTDLTEHEEPPPVDVDLSGLSLNELGARISEEEEVPDLDVDLSGLSLDEPGTTLVEPEEPEEPDIDISKLKLSGD